MNRFYAYAISCFYAILFLVPALAFILWFLKVLPLGPGFLRQPDYQQVAFYIMAAWVLIFLSALWLNLRNPELNPDLDRSKGGILLGLLGGVMFAHIYTAVSIPILAYWITAEQSTLTTTVVKVTPEESRQSRCRASITMEFDTQIWSKLCVSPSAIERITIGDQILLRGKANGIAFYVDKMAISASSN